MNKAKIFIAALALLANNSFGRWAQVSPEETTVENAMSAYHEKDYAAAAKIIPSLAALTLRSDSQDKYISDFFCPSEDLLDKNNSAREKKLVILKVSINARAKYAVGLFYQEGLGVKQDLTKAREWFHRAAAGGDVLAKNHLGDIYAKARDYAKAREWYEQAAAQCH